LIEPFWGQKLDMDWNGMSHRTVLYTASELLLSVKWFSRRKSLTDRYH